MQACSPRIPPLPFHRRKVTIAPIAGNRDHTALALLALQAPGDLQRSKHVGTGGMPHVQALFGPRAWHPYYVRHELIHQLQHERLGSYRFVRAPKWFIEGMAYAMSDDPRAVLAEPCQQYRARFEAWRRGLGQRELWAEARRLPVE